MAFGYTTKKGSYFANPQIGKRAEQDDDERTSALKPLDKGDEDETPTDGIEVHIKHIGPHGTMTKKDEDGKEDHEYENLTEMHDKLNKFFNEEEDEFKKNPDEEKEYHKGSMGDEDEESNPFSDMKGLGLK